MYGQRVTRRVLLLPLLAVVGCGSATSAGYNDPGRLADRLRETAQERMDKNREMYEGAKVTETKCVGSAERVFKCSGEISSGERWTITVTVSEDGKTYVSEG